MKIATLGPQGTFSHEAAARLEPGLEIVFQRTIRDVFEYVSGTQEASGLVPLENSVSGTVAETLDNLTESQLQIEREVIHPVIHHLAVRHDAGKITTILAHPQSYSQCEKFIRSNYPEANIIQTSSNGRSAEMLRDSAEPGLAAIVPELAVQLYGLLALRSQIQDNRYNLTRFVLISRNSTKSSGYDRTSLAIYPQVDYPGLLHEMLSHLASRGVNLSKVESRPSKGRLGDYIFFMDLQGHSSDERVAEAIEALKKIAFVRVLGSYPRQY